jgi:hypothetical protein
MSRFDGSWLCCDHSRNQLKIDIQLDFIALSEAKLISISTRLSLVPTALKLSLSLLLLLGLAIPLFLLLASGLLLHLLSLMSLRRKRLGGR